ncbi:Uncharacterised protein [Delftia tsuruhatensis]|nr:Uncharacterised protein [Delftia tsuruhatensis]
MGLVAPARTPAPVIAALHRQVVASINEPAVRQKLVDFGVEPVSMKNGMAISGKLWTWATICCTSRSSGTRSEVAAAAMAPMSSAWAMGMAITAPAMKTRSMTKDIAISLSHQCGLGTGLPVPACCAALHGAVAPQARQADCSASRLSMAMPAITQA